MQGQFSEQTGDVLVNPKTHGTALLLLALYRKQHDQIAKGLCPCRICYMVREEPQTHIELPEVTDKMMNAL